jgi:hypothetical protein
MLHMADNTPTSAEVFEATHEDLVSILAWLKREYDEDGSSGFWCNRGVISDAFDKPENLWVIRRNGEAVAFQVGEYAADIISVRKDHQKCGMATSLLEGMWDRTMFSTARALPSPTLRRRFPSLVRLVRRYYGTVRLLQHVHVLRSVYGPRGPALIARPRRAGDLPVLVHVVS